MDFKGQALAELQIIRILVAFAAIGFLAGYVMRDFRLCVYINAVGLVLTLLLVVPDWPMYNRQALDWLPPLEATDALAKGKKK